MSKKEKGKIISFINMKGGVGKTTLTVSLAKKLSKDNKVLVIDMDPQFNATQSLLSYQQNIRQSKMNNYEPLNTELFKFLMDKNQTLLQLFQSNDTDVNSLSPINIASNLYLLAGDVRLITVVADSDLSKACVLDNYLEQHDLKSKYDYILIDCSPMWSILTHSSLTASDYYVIPSKVDFHAFLGIKLLIQTVQRYIINDHASKRKLVPLGVIFTLTNQSLKVENKMRDELIKQNSEVYFFNQSLPYMPSASSKWVVIDVIKSNNMYSSLENSFEKILSELIARINIAETANSLQHKEYMKYYK
ncbi:hypothetical protein AN640_00600 [Candidatus Epulonipiscium fishelsonii]|uniref:Uncharacterized protein n=1 Tax=Candidatus Epulonipiscium fishelsonii TaxID=77094 RepID=A0ACC8X7W9_9FIRM|nr:hypothetical protein AN640_00600 [Epulopiscium sp. SCG-D08WGA-EpuloA1]OON94417.1 MAG: hypothetical protein ATN32_08220 [Epulopiscium sp. AS2M-Bin002]